MCKYKGTWNLRQEILDSPVQILTDYGLSDKIAEKMYMEGFRLISDITLLTEEKFFSWPNMGPRSIAELRRILTYYLHTVSNEQG